MSGPLLTGLAVIVYGFIHSALASSPAKRLARRALGPLADRYYRLAYNVVAIISLLPVFAVIGLAPGQLLYRLPMPWALLTLAGQAVALFLVAAGLLETDVWHFLGVRQLAGDAIGRSKLVATGLYRWVRHPLYAAGLLLLWLSPIMTTSLLTFNAAFTAYVLVAYPIEERRLMAEFGAAYAEYRRRVPALIPLPGRIAASSHAS